MTLPPDGSEFEREERRIRSVYAARDEAGARVRYEPALAVNRLWRSVRERVARDMMRRAGADDLANLEVLDIGCGAGDWLETLETWGATPEKLHGIDLLEGRVAEARERLPRADVRVASGWAVPFGDDSLDLVCLNTVFSSIVAPEARMALAREVSRITRCQGAVLVYDFRISHPLNADTVGIGRREILRLFPGATVEMRALTLAPPLARRVAPVAPKLVLFLERYLPVLCTHRMYLVRTTSPA